MIIVGVYLVIRSAVYFPIILRRALQFPLEASRHALCSLFNQCGCLLASFYPSPMCASCHQTFRPSANWNRECEQLMYVETTLCKRTERRVLASCQRVVSNCSVCQISNTPRVRGTRFFGCWTKNEIKVANDLGKDLLFSLNSQTIASI